MAFTQLRIDNNDLNLVIDSKVLRNLYAQTSTPVGMERGVVNADYQGSARGVSQVGITVFNRTSSGKRILGSQNNGGFISTSPQQLTTNRTLALQLLNRIDPIYQLPQSQQGMLNYSVVQQIAYNVSEEVRENIDKDTLEEMYNAAVTFGSGLTTPFSNIFKFDLSTEGEAFKALQKAKNYLTNLPANTQDTSAPHAGRVQVVRELVYNDYIGSKGIVVAGSDLGLKTLVLGVEGYTDVLGQEYITNTSWRGIIFGVNTYIAPDAFFPEPETGEVYGIVSHPIATTRAMHTEQSKIVNATNFLGELWQGAWQYGILTTRPHMVAVLASSDWAEA